MKKNRYNVISGLAVSAIVTTLLLWGVISVTNGDPLWFLHRFDARAETLIIYWDGDVTTLEPGDGAYEPVMAAFAAAMAQPAGFENGAVLTEQAIEAHREQYRMLEVHFAEPAQVHTRHPYSESATYLVPLSERYARLRRVYTFLGLVPYTSGPLNLAPSSFDALVRAVEGAVSVASAK
jgi:hypothetical protein